VFYLSSTMMKRVIQQAATSRQRVLFGGAAARSLKNGRMRGSGGGGAAASTLLKDNERSYSSSSTVSSAASGTSPSTKFAWTDEMKKFQGEGILDDRGLTVFDTLHEMQVRSCKVFEDRQLFGTYADASGKFEWMTYGEYADNVDSCRAMLKDLGECDERKRERELVVRFAAGSELYLERHDRVVNFGYDLLFYSYSCFCTSTFCPFVRRFGLR